METTEIFFPFMFNFAASRDEVSFGIFFKNGLIFSDC